MKNQDLLAIAQEFGSPVYVYDAAKIEKQYKRLTSAFDKVGKLRINYAVQALSNISVLKLIIKTRLLLRFTAAKIMKRWAIGLGQLMKLQRIMGI